MEFEDPAPLARILGESRILPRRFYERPSAEVARDLLGKVIVHDGAAGEIVETEAYLGLHDLAAHASHGITGRTRVLFGPPGHAYVYLSYGMHECLNIVAEPDGVPGCVLIRALQPLSGLRIMKQRRPAAKRREDLASGPGKLTAAMDITRRHYGADVTRGPITIRAFKTEAAVEIVTTTRVGVTQSADWPLRFYIAGNRFVSRR